MPGKRTLLQIAHKPHLRRRTVRLRLTLLYGGLFLVSGAALLAITYVLVVHNTGGFIFKTQNGLAGTVITPGHAETLHPKPGAPQLSLSARGSRLLTSKQAAAQARQLQAEAAHQHAAVLHQLLVQSTIALAGMSVLSIALGWIVAGRVLRPLRTITTTARDISATNLHRRLALEGPGDELKELGDTIDALLARLQTAFQAQRRFVANASHELRTPLARQRTIAQVALADPHATAETLRTAHEDVLASGAEQERLIEALLTLARSQGGIEKHDVVDLCGLTEEVLLTRQAEAGRVGLTLHADLTRAPATGDRRLLERMIANMVDNAIRHNIQGGRVEVRAQSRGSHAIVSVANTGPLIPAHAIERLTQPFTRLAPDRTGRNDGIGLGLSIVQAIAEAHHATLTIESQPEGGLRVQASFRRRESLTGAPAGSNRAETLASETRTTPLALPTPERAD